MWQLLLSTSVLYFFCNTEGDNDLWGHLQFGRDLLAAGTIPRLDSYSYTAAGHPWMNHEWLSQVVMAALYNQAGSGGLLMVKFALATLAFLFLFADVRQRTDSPHVRGTIGLLVIAVFSRGLAPRPQVFTYCFVTLTLLLLGVYSRGRTAVLWCFPAIFLLWANFHGGFVLGLGILALFAAADLLAGARRALGPWLALAASAVAVTITPYGLQLLGYIVNELQRPHPITEWQPAAIETAQFAFFFLLILFCVTIVFTPDWRRDGWRVLLALGVGLLALRHQRHTPVFALCAAAPLTSQLHEAARRLVPRLPHFGPASRRILAVAFAGLALLQLGLLGKRFGESGLSIVYDPSEYPVAAVRALGEAGFQGNLAVPLDWGEYVLWFLAPQVKVSLDGRFATLFPEAVVEDNFNFFAGGHGWQRLIEAYPTQAALLPASRPSPLRSLSDWRLAYRDSVAEVYVRSSEVDNLGLGALPLAVPEVESRAAVFP